jgi:altronate dehydratase
LDAAGDRVLEFPIQVASGSKTKAETIGYSGSTAIYQAGPIV